MHGCFGGGNGEYTKEQIVDLFTTAYTSFLGARLESQRQINVKAKKPMERKRELLFTLEIGEQVRVLVVLCVLITYFVS